MEEPVSSVVRPVWSSVEQFFRYLIPGIAFVVLLKAFFPGISNRLTTDVIPSALKQGVGGPLLLFISGGMLVYGLHRILLWGTIEVIFYKLNQTAVSNFASDDRRWREYPEALAKFTQTRQKLNGTDRNLSDYLYYRWAIHHMGAIMGELLIVFSILSWGFPDQKSTFPFNRTYLGLALLFWVFMLLLLWKMYRVDKWLVRPQGS